MSTTTSSNRLNNKSDTESDRHHSRSGTGRRKNILTVDQLFPSETNKSGTKGKRLDINTLFSGTATNPDVVIDMSHETLIQRKKQRKEDLHRQYMLEYKRCWERINSADQDGLNEFIFEAQPIIERFPEYSPLDCIELIQDKLRTEEFMDTAILDNNQSIYICWVNIEANRDAYLDELESDDKSEKETDTDRDDHNDTNEMRKDFDQKINSIADPNVTETELDTDKE
jgi:hypothetical protein